MENKTFLNTLESAIDTVATLRGQIAELKKELELQKQAFNKRIEGEIELRDQVLHSFENVLVDIKEKTGYIPHNTSTQKDVIQHVRELLYGDLS